MKRIIEFRELYRESPYLGKLPLQQFKGGVRANSKGQYRLGSAHRKYAAGLKSPSQDAIIWHTFFCLFTR